MNNRLTLLDLAELLAVQTGKSKREMEQFLRTFVELVSRQLFRDKLVKVKGVGTFKLILVEQRESVQVNTGERFVIPAHYKFSFMPDKEIKERVNKPFSFFEVTELNAKVDFPDLKEEVVEESKLEADEVSVEELTITDQSEPRMPDPLISTEKTQEDVPTNASSLPVVSATELIVQPVRKRTFRWILLLLLLALLGLAGWYGWYSYQQAQKASVEIRMPDEVVSSTDF